MKPIYKCTLLFSISLLLAIILGSSKQTDATQTAPKGMILLKKEGRYPFYISVTEETNLQWKTYMDWNKAVYKSFPELYVNAIPADTSAKEFGTFNDPIFKNQVMHPAFSNYPVCGVTWNQVNRYLEWKTDRLNEMILNEVKLLKINGPDQVDANNFNTESYLTDQYEPYFGKSTRSYHSKFPRNNYNEMYFETVIDGILFPQYRLPTEEEWLYAESSIASGEYNDQIKSSMRQSDFLNHWYQLYNSKSGYKATTHIDPKTILTGFKGGAMEWLLEIENDQPTLHSSELEILLNNGWKTFESSLPYDNYGSLKEKDSIGRLNFRFVQVASHQAPIFLSHPNALTFSINYDTVINPYFGMSYAEIHSSLKTQFSNAYKLYQKESAKHTFPHYVSSFESYLVFQNLLQFYPSPSPKLYPRVRTLPDIDTAVVKRKYVQSYVNNCSYSVNHLSQLNTRQMLGFRCVLPYTGVAVSKKHKVNW